MSSANIDFTAAAVADVGGSEPPYAVSFAQAQSDEPSSITGRSFDRRSGFAPQKRALDLTLALLMLILFLPLFLLVYLAVRLSSPGPAIYGHERVGLNGRRFKCLKFRTMVVDGDELLRRHLASQESARIEWETSRKLKSDPRVTPLGATLRVSSLDELPQLLNVIRGEMSLVGPRPVVQDEIGYYGPYAGHYLSTRPGLTGLWQVSGRSDLSYGERVMLDRDYVENWSMAGDLGLILRTIPAVLGRRGTC